MPNTPALVGEGASAISGGAGTTDEDLDWAERILGGVGLVVRVDEGDLDVVTGLSGSGPAYVFLVAEALIDAAVAAGLAPDLASTLTSQLLVGSAKLLAERGDRPPCGRWSRRPAGRPPPRSRSSTLRACGPLSARRCRRQPGAGRRLSPDR